MTRIGVIGANGFIGRALVKHCQRRGVELVATQRSSALVNAASYGVWHRFDLCDEAAQLSIFDDCDWLICLAGTAHVAASAHVYATEARAYQRLLGQLLASDKRVIYISSVKAQDADDHYSRAKRSIEDFLQSQSSANWVVLRPALVYGSEMKGFLAQWSKAIASGWMPRLPELANRRSLVSIENLLSAIDFAMQQPACLGRIFTVTDATCYSSSELQAGLLQAAGRQWCLPALPQSIWRMMAYLGDCLPRSPWSSAHYQRLFGDANYQDDALAQLGWQPHDNFAAFCQRQLR